MAGVFLQSETLHPVALVPPLEIQYLPVAGVLVHALHTDVLAYFPISQTVQLAAPADEMDPELHFGQSVSADGVH